MRYLFIPILLLHFCSCEQQAASTSNSQSEIELLKMQKDTLQEIATSINNKQLGEERENPKIPEEYVYAVIDYTMAKETLLPGKKIEGRYNSIDGKYSPEINIPDQYKYVDVPYFYISPIRPVQWNSMYLDENLKYKFLDEMEADLRLKTIGNTIKIVNRDVKIFSTYAEASKSIEQLKTINH